MRNVASFACAAALAALMSAPVAGAPTNAAASQFALDVAALTRAPHRLAGTEEGRAASAYVAQRLAAIGVDRIITQEFMAAQAFTKRCDLADKDSGKTFSLLPMRPNGIVPPVTPPEGITGPLLWLGKGSNAEFDRKDPQGSIAVMDYNCGDRWLRAFRLGARAVVFVKTGPLESLSQHYVAVPAPLPRYYFNGNREALVEGHTATIMCEVPWRQVTCRNIIGVLTGSGRTFPLGKPESVVLSAQLDSFGEVPDLSPGARGAANCAALLSIAAHLKAHKPERDVLLAFFDNEARSLAGSMTFYWPLETVDDNATIKTRRKSWVEETAFLSQMVAVAQASTSSVSRSGDVGVELLDRLGKSGEDHAFGVRSSLMDVRMAVNTAKAAGKPDPVLEAREKSLKTLHDRWNDLRRGLGKSPCYIHTNAMDLYRICIGEVTAQIIARQAELARTKRTLDASTEIEALLKERNIALHAALMLGDSTKRWGVIIGGNADIHSSRDIPGLYGQVQNAIAKAVVAGNATGSYLSGFEMASVDSSLEKTRVLWTAPCLVHGGEIAGRFGIYNVALGTMLERLPREGTPDDTVAALDVQCIERNAAEVAALLGGPGVAGQAAEAALLSLEVLSVRSGITVEKEYIPAGFEGGRPSGALVMARQRGSSMPNRNVPGAVIMIWYYDSQYALPQKTFLLGRKAYGFDQFSVLMTDQNGSYSLGPLPTYDVRGFCALFDDRGSISLASDQESINTVRTRLNMIQCHGSCAVLPPTLWPVEVNVYDARSNAQLFNSTSQRSCVQTMDGVVFWYVEPRIEAVKLFTLKSMVALGSDTNLGSGEMTAYGAGLPVDGDWPALMPGTRAAADIWKLDEWRLSVLRARDIINSSLEEIHGRTLDMTNNAARTALPTVREAISAAAFLTESPIYTAIRTTMDDLVKAVLILLGLSVPFAFALERLLIGSAKIQKQVAWFTVFFTLTFLCLYFTSPAFAIAKTPIIIFLGFAVVTLSVLVIVIIMQKFQVEIKAMQGLTSTVHTADISRFNTIMAAMAMGISTMRRRPLRTALTAITILLLTFTILCFASFDTRIGIIKLFIGPSPAYTGAQVYRPTREEFNEEFLDTLRGQWADKATICPRYWLCPQQRTDAGQIIATSNATRLVTIKAVLGITPVELEKRKDLASVFAVPHGKTLDDMVFITTAVATMLGVKPGDTVLVKGLPLVVGPLLSASKLSVQRDMDGGSILPVDFVQARSTQSEQKKTTVEDQSAWANLPADVVVATSADNTRTMGGMIHSICMYTEDAHGATQVAEGLARTLEQTPIAGTRSDGVYRHVQGTVLAASGIADLFLPLLLGGLIVFGTMLSSVSDREKEIYTFSALGLAPAHVAGLFFAEAMVYSVIGGLGGYLLAQGSMKLLALIASVTPLRVPEMNYSSTNAIFTILVVMATVLVSATYPAIQASKSANPGLLRSWRLSKPVGNIFDLLFPFTVSEYDLTGVVGFLKEHFDNFSDTGLGCFMARDVSITVDELSHLGLKANIALAPFDLGVTQSFELQSSPSEIAGIDEVRIKLTRLSGQPKDWARLNKVLLNDLRRQFLLWRSLPQETMEVYRQRTLAFLGPRTSRPSLTTGTGN